MATLFLEQLRNAGFLRGPKADSERIVKTPVSRLIEISAEAAEITSAANFPAERSSFSHSATLSLGGGREPCISLDCRLNHARQLAQFGALYSDRVYVYNFLAEYAAHSKKYNSESEDEIRNAFADDLAVIAELHPLIEAGNIVPITPPRHVCPRCFSDLSLGEDTDKNFRHAERELTRRCEEDVEVHYTNLGDAFSFTATGPESLLEHGSQSVFYPLPPTEAKWLPSSLKKLPLWKEIVISKPIARRSGIFTQLASDIFKNVRFELAMSRCMNTRFLTDREVHVYLLRSLSRDESLVRRDEMIRKHLTCLVPFVDFVEPADLLLLRNQEAEAFILFRRTLTKAIEECQKCRKQFTKQDAEQIYGDIIAPQLAKLDLKVKAAQRKFRTSSLRKSLSWIGAVSFGIYTGIVPENLHTAAIMLGLVKPAAEILEMTMNNSDVESTIRQEEVYFLWKLRNISRRR